jgi:hypothetical protein
LTLGLRRQSDDDALQVLRAAMTIMIMLAIVTVQAQARHRYGHKSRA